MLIFGGRATVNISISELGDLIHLGIQSVDHNVGKDQLRLPTSSYSPTMTHSNTTMNDRENSSSVLNGKTVAGM
jgi:hypothetical protein